MPVVVHLKEALLLSRWHNWCLCLVQSLLVLTEGITENPILPCECPSIDTDILRQDISHPWVIMSDHISDMILVDFFDQGSFYIVSSIYNCIGIKTDKPVQFSIVLANENIVILGSTFCCDTQAAICITMTKRVWCHYHQHHRHHHQHQVAQQSHQIEKVTPLIVLYTSAVAKIK